MPWRCVAVSASVDRHLTIRPELHTNAAPGIRAGVRGYAEFDFLPTQSHGGRLATLPVNNDAASGGTGGRAEKS